MGADLQGERRLAKRAGSALPVHRHTGKSLHRGSGWTCRFWSHREVRLKQTAGEQGREDVTQGQADFRQEEQVRTEMGDGGEGSPGARASVESTELPSSLLVSHP